MQYSAEAFPLYLRDIGMSFATAVLWGFNFILALTFPRLLGAFKPQGAFGFYAAWKYVYTVAFSTYRILMDLCFSIFGFFAVMLFLPETKALSLEELDQVFSVPTHVHASYQLKAVPRNIKKYIFRMKVDPLPPLYDTDGITKTYAPGGAGHA